MERLNLLALRRFLNMTSPKSSAIKFLEGLRGGPLTFGDMIESIRLCDEIPQAELARKMKISRAHLCDIEKGRRMVSAERAAQFAKVMGYSVNQFVATVLEDQLRKAGLKVRVRLDAA
jgi:antitoxin HigA-1